MSQDGVLGSVDRALILAASVDLSDAEVAELGGLLAGADGVFHDAWMTRLHLNDVAPQVWLTLTRLELSDRLRTRDWAAVCERRQEVEAKNLRRLREIEGLFETLAARDIPVIVLKGVLFAETIWRDHGYKKMNDLDILIREQDLAAVLEVYRERDYLPLILFEGGDLDDIDVEKTHHLPSFVSRDLEFVVGTHWGLVARKSGIRLDYPRIWADSVELPFQSTRARAMAPLDNLVHLAVHFHHYKTGVKELSDIFNLARISAPLDWEELRRRIVAAGAASRAYYSLSLANALRALGPSYEVAGFLAELREQADAFSRSEVDLRLSRLELMTRSRSLYEAVIEKAFTRFLVETSFHAKLLRCLIFWLRLLVPPGWVLTRTNVAERLTVTNAFGLYWRNLVRTGRVMSESMGEHPWVAAMLASVVLSAKALPNYWRDLEHDPLGDLVEALGGDERKLDALMEFLE